MTKLVMLCVLTISLLACSLPLQRDVSAAQEVETEKKLQTLLQQATLLLRKADDLSLSGAESLLVLAHEIKARDARVVDAFGCLAWRRSQKELAAEYFRSAITLDRNYDRAYAHLALVAESDGDFVAARELLLIALFLNPLNHRARNNLAAVLIDHEKNEEAAYFELLKVYGSGKIADPVLEHNRSYLNKTLKRPMADFPIPRPLRISMQ